MKSFVLVSAIAATALFAGAAEARQHNDSRKMKAKSGAAATRALNEAQLAQMATMPAGGAAAAPMAAPSSGMSPGTMAPGETSSPNAGPGTMTSPSGATPNATPDATMGRETMTPGAGEAGPGTTAPTTADPGMAAPTTVDPAPTPPPQL